MLLFLAISENWLSFLNWLIFASSLYVSSVPPPPPTRPKVPCFLSSFNSMLIVFSSLPSSIPENSENSDFLSKTCTLSTASAAKFLVAICGSSPKNSFPSTSTLLTSSPCALMLPSRSTSTPGNFFSKSSTTALGWVLKAKALYSMVSFFISIGTRSASTTSSSKRSASKTMVPRPTSSPFTVTFFE